MCTVEHRGSHGDLLHRVVATGVSALRQQLEDADRELPGFVWRELERYVGCGDLRQGFAWLQCADCDHHRLVPFSCKGRAFCPGCTGRRMAETAARWCDDLLPTVPYRHWVLTAPWVRRKPLAYRPELPRGVLQAALDEVFGWARGTARERLGLEDARTGAVTVTQRFASSLALNVHYHSLLPDGVWALGEGGALVFHRLSPTRGELQALVERISRRPGGCTDCASPLAPPHPTSVHDADRVRVQWHADPRRTVLRRAPQGSAANLMNQISNPIGRTAFCAGRTPLHSL